MAKKIIEFYGAECPYCMALEEAVEKLEDEDGIEVEGLEVWHSEENKKRMASLKHLYDQNCNGNFVVPSFYDEEKDRLICNPGDYEDLKNWVFAE